MNAFFIFLLIVVAIGIYLIYIYNNLVSLKAAIDGAYSDIDVQLKRRLDLVGALVKVVQGYKDYEASTLEKIVKLRNKALNTQDIREYKNQ